MPASRVLTAMAAICAVVLIAAAAMASQPVLAPVVFAVFAIALVWPLQGALQRRMPAVLAMLLTLLVALVTLVGLAMLVAWAFGRVGAWVVANGAMLQALYLQKLALADRFGIEAAGMLAAQFDARWVVRMAQAVLGQLQSLLSFILLTLVFVLLGLLEVNAVAFQLGRLGEGGRALRRGIERTAAKLRAYMLVRTLMSVLTGLVVWGFAAAMGLELAAEWGAIALVLNYIPFLGPLVATLFPTLFAALQFGNWQFALAVFAGLQVVQFLGGSYIEPRLTGKSLALSPFLVLVSVFVGGFLWGIPGAFIGTPLLIAALTIAEEFPGARPYAALCSGRAEEP
jgi:predicted PurR-regulated permease PerM